MIWKQNSDPSKCLYPHALKLCGKVELRLPIRDNSGLPRSNQTSPKNP